MVDILADVTNLATGLVALDSRSGVSNLAVAERIEAELAGFDCERLDYRDADGVAKRALVAVRGESGLALSGHMDTVPDTGWTEDPWSARVQGGRLSGLGSTDMKGPLAACIVAARRLPQTIPIALFVTTDEETTKQGARLIVERSELARRFRPRGIVVAEPTGMVPVRGHRAHIGMTITAVGVQAHSSSGRGRNANWDLAPFLVDMRDLHLRLRQDPTLQDAAYDPPFSDFNLVIDNHGAAVNVTVPRATARIKFRYSASVDPAPVLAIVQAAAQRHGLALEAVAEGRPPELASDHPLVRLACSLTGKEPGTAPFGTDASQLQALASCVVLGPGDIAVAHAPGEDVCLQELADAVPRFMQMAEQVASG